MRSSSSAGRAPPRRTGPALAAIASVALGGCALDLFVLEGLPCSPAGDCAQGFWCDQASGRCLPDPGSECGTRDGGGAGAPVAYRCSLDRGACRSGQVRCVAGRWTDCDGVRPVVERCDGADDDCDGLTDEGFSVGQACQPPGSGCRPTGVWVCAADGSADCLTDGVPQDLEVCDGLDNDCDGLTDNQDIDGDGYWGCPPEQPIDCDDSRSDVYPGAAERCDRVDQDCDGQPFNDFIEAGWTCTAGVGACFASATYICVGGELRCPVSPGAPRPEECNGLDDDCDSDVDEDLALVGQPCSVGTGACRAWGLWECHGLDGLVCPAVPGPPGIEVCDPADGERDDDCDGLTDNVDADSDRHWGCPYWVLADRDQWDCDDGEPRRYVGARELCDGLDNDCDDATPDGASDPRLGSGLPCDGPDSDECFDDSYVACTGGALVCSLGADDLEARWQGATCTDGVDNDCDGDPDLADADCWWDHAWSRRLKLSFLVADLSEDQVEVPVLVVLEERVFPGPGLDASSFMFSDLQSGSTDELRFVDSDDATELAYEIERWSIAGPPYQVLLWVRVPRVDAGADTDFIWLYYGHPEPPPRPAGLRHPWTNGFEGVWHLSESPGPHRPTFRDSTGHGHTGHNYGAVPVAGRIGLGQAFDGGTDAIVVPHHDNLNFSGVNYTLEAWAWVYNDNESYNLILGKNDWSDNYSLFTAWGSGSNFDVYTRAYETNNTLRQTNSGLGPFGAWTYLAATRIGSELYVFRDGVWKSSTTLTTGPKPHTLNLRFAGYPSSSNSSMRGWLDEVRVSRTNRTAPWFAVQHRSMTNALLRYGPAQRWR